jgi:hypothetical protein
MKAGQPARAAAQAGSGSLTPSIITPSLGESGIKVERRAPVPHPGEGQAHARLPSRSGLPWSLRWWEGTSMTEVKPRGLLLVMIEVDPAHEADFNRWYNEEHVPERLSVPGFLNARRFVAIEGEPKYLALYDLEGPDVLQTEAYTKLLAGTPWTNETKKHWIRSVRNVYTEIPTKS